MADTAYLPDLEIRGSDRLDFPRHSLVVRVTHWITALSFLALLVSGILILIAHPRLYWGETGGVAGGGIGGAAGGGDSVEEALGGELCQDRRDAGGVESPGGELFVQFTVREIPAGEKRDRGGAHRAAVGATLRIHGPHVLAQGHRLLRSRPASQGRA